MATIGTAIRLTDMMSDPLEHISKAMNMMLSTWEDLDRATSGGLDINGVEAIRSEIDQATRGLQRMEDEQEDFNQDVQQGARHMDGLTDKILGAVGAFVTLQSVGKLVGLSDQYVQIQARLNMINDGLQTTEQLNDKIFASAQRARASYVEMADTVSKLSLNAGDAFGSNNETILFAENLNKLFAIAGTEQSQIASATLQLTQALGSGVLRGEEFNAVFEAAPNIMQTVADYMGVPIGKMRELAQEGQITADVVKYALLSATDEINAKFETMPMTWAQVWQGILNSVYYASQPLLQMINWMAQNWQILQPIIMGVATALAIYAAIALISSGITAVQAFMSSVQAVQAGFAAGKTFLWAVQQHGLNAALAACPLTWIIIAIIAIIAAIYAVVAAINKAKGTSISATGVIMGAFAAAGAFIWNVFVGLVDLALACVNAIANPWIRFANFFGNIFNDPIAAIINMFHSLADSVLSILESIAGAIDAVFGSNLASAVAGWRSGLGGMVEKAVEKYGNGSYEKVAEELDLSAADLGLERWSYSNAYNTGYEFGADMENKVGDSIDDMFGGFTMDEYSMNDLMGIDDPTIGDMSGLGGGGGGLSSKDLYPAYDELGAMNDSLDDIKGSAGNIEDSLDITSESLKYLRDIAEQEVINRFTTAEISVNMGGVNNTVNQNTDLDGVIDYMVTGINEAMERVAEGVHS